MALQPYPTITSDDPQTLMDAINAIARIRLQDIALANNLATTMQNVATTGCVACTATGTNTIALQQNANQTVISGYTNYQQFSFVAAHNSSGNVTVNINGIGALNLYQSDGVTQATTGTITAATLYTIAYNSALNSAAGGFQIISGTPAPASGLTVGTTTIAGGTTGYIVYDNSGVVGELATTGSGNVVLATSATLVTPALGTPASGNLSNCTGFPTQLMTALGVGSIILALNAGSSVSAGGTTAASNLTPKIFSGSTLSNGSDSIAGTWRALQSVGSGSSYSTLWQRTV